MPVVPRALDDGDGSEITSPKVASKTVVGMVLGVLCLFTMVLSYQLISCSWRKQRQASLGVPHSGSSAIHTTHTHSEPTPSFHTFFQRLLRLFSYPRDNGEASEKGVPSPGPRDRPRPLRALLLSFTHDHNPSSGPTESSHASQRTPHPTIRERRALRALRLNTTLSTSPRKQYPSTPSPLASSRKRIGRLFLFGPTTPDTPTPLPPYLSPTSPFSRRHYAKLDDSMYSDWSNNAKYHTERPPEAILSPWSPNEHEYPYPPYSPLDVNSLSGFPGTPPPLYPPPPAYLPEVPTRATRSNPTTPTRPRASRNGAASTLVPPVSPIVSSLNEEIDGEIGGWDMTSEIRAAFAHTANTCEDDDVFVISNASDEDGASSELDTVSLRTDESTKPLSL
ncbi:hypothetical protein BD310DRAFT_500717 [Dichomitus squalens]|uniref:Uncharacterized protein n=1 Tax=Dichomitus squalens TaxID=114155 RepID=A0A4Q9PUC2_9APHY|nr:hypothetical protein BD310DRAFT_500717 [Dichomitus squalens]